MAASLAQPAPASASAVALPFPTFDSLLPDSHGHVFVTGGPATSVVAVRGADGEAVASIANQPGAAGLVLSADGGTLYVALPEAQAISAISTTTLAETARFGTPAACPQDLALVGTAVWFTNSCGESQLGRVVPATASFGLSSVKVPQGRVLGVPGDPTSLVVGTSGQSSVDIWRYSVSGATLTQAAHHAGADGPIGVETYLHDMAIDTDGQHVVISCSTPFAHPRLKLSDLSGDGFYAGQINANSVAVSPALGGLVATGSHLNGSGDLWIYRAGQQIAPRDLGSGSLHDAGLAWAPDGSRLYAAASDGLHVMADAALANTFIRLSGPWTAPQGSVAQVTGSIQGLSGWLAGVTLQVGRSDASGTTHLSDVVTDVSGQFVFDDTVGTSDVSYTVAFGGDGFQGPTSNTVTIAVVKRPTVLSLSAPTGTVPRAASYTLSGALTASDLPVAGATVTLKRTDLAGVRTIIVTTSDAGTFTYQDVPPVGGTVSWAATYAGSSSDMPATRAQTVSVARVATAMTLTVDHTVVPYGSPVHLTVRLGRTFSSRTVSIYAHKLNSAATTRIRTVTVGSSGVVSLPVTLTAKTVISARFAGDYRYAPKSASRTVNVATRVTVTVRRAIGRSGAAYVVRKGGNALLTARVLPVRTAGCVAFEWQMRLGGVWQTTSVWSCQQIYPKGQAYILFVPHGYVGVQRVRALVAAGPYSGGGASAWIYLKSV